MLFHTGLWSALCITAIASLAEARGMHHRVERNLDGTDAWSRQSSGPIRRDIALGDALVEYDNVQRLLYPRMPPVTRLAAARSAQSASRARASSASRSRLRGPAAGTRSHDSHRKTYTGKLQGGSAEHRGRGRSRSQSGSRSGSRGAANSRSQSASSITNGKLSRTSSVGRSRSRSQSASRSWKGRTRSSNRKTYVKKMNEDGSFSMQKAMKASSPRSRVNLPNRSKSPAAPGTPSRGSENRRSRSHSFLSETTEGSIQSEDPFFKENRGKSISPSHPKNMDDLGKANVIGGGIVGLKPGKKPGEKVLQVSMDGGASMTDAAQEKGGREAGYPVNLPAGEYERPSPAIKKQQTKDRKALPNATEFQAENDKNLEAVGRSAFGRGKPQAKGEYPPALDGEVGNKSFSTVDRDASNRSGGAEGVLTQVAKSGRYKGEDVKEAILRDQNVKPTKSNKDVYRHTKDDMAHGGGELHAVGDDVVPESGSSKSQGKRRRPSSGELSAAAA